MGPAVRTASHGIEGFKAGTVLTILVRTIEFSTTESLILAQDERWRRALHMQVAREREARLDPSLLGNLKATLVKWRTGA